MIRIKNRFIDKGIPVILGEFGALNKNNLNDRVEWAKYYVKSARSHGIPPIWWDNGSFSGSGENFGLLNRAKLVWAFPEIVDAMNSALK